MGTSCSRARRIISSIQEIKRNSGTVLSCEAAQSGCNDVCAGFGDCDGVVVAPREKEDQVFEKAQAKFAKEEKLVEELKAGKTTLEIYGFDKLIKKLEEL